MATRKYELMVILDPLRGDEQQKESLDKIEETIAKYGGTAEKRDVWGKRRLAYQINKRRDGYYTVITFSAESTATTLAELERYLRYAEDVLRYLVTQAVVGKSAGNPALYVESEARAPRPGGRPGFGRGRREDYAPAPAAEAVAAPVEAASEPVQ